MKIVLLIAASLLAGLLAVNAQSNNNSEKEIRSWLHQFTNAFNEKNVDAIMALYTDDVVAYDIVPPLQYVGKAAYRADYQQFFSQYEGGLHLEARDVHVGATSELGYLTCLELIRGTLKGGQKSDVWVRATSLFRKVNGHWLDFHDHISVPADMESGKAMLELSP
jgi:ketosteroid isomerase-like protein